MYDDVCGFAHVLWFDVVSSRRCRGPMRWIFKGIEILLPGPAAPWKIGTVRIVLLLDLLSTLGGILVFFLSADLGLCIRMCVSLSLSFSFHRLLREFSHGIFVGMADI